MTNKAKRTLLTVSGLILALLLLLSVLAVLAVRRSFPQVNGALRLPGLEANVEVLRDELGVPHIYANTQHDLFMAQGFVHAQDRFWQMDFWRHIGSGRVAEIAGESQLETDRFLRMLGWHRVAEQEYAQASPETRALLDAYAEGVNAYLAERSGSALSLEYLFLGILNPDYQPEPWHPIHTITWGKAMAWDLGGNMDTELRRAVLLSKIGPERLAELYPPYPSEHPVIVPGFGPGSTAGDPWQPAWLSQELWLPSIDRLLGRIESLNALTGGGIPGIGSNNWVIGGQRTTTGSPILADDMHLPIQMPSIWYEMGLHCQPVSSACPFNLVGFTFAGVPAVIVGHNEHIAWGVTNVGPDVQDLYLEKINPANPNQYEVNGAWVDMLLVEEVIQVAGGDPVPITIRYTRHGPVISDQDDELAALAERHAGQGSHPIAISLRWTALDPGTIFNAVLQLATASNWQEFRQALQDWDVPSQNFVYADREGNIGYQTPGRIPIRASGDGRMPAIGWTDEQEWTGFIPFNELPTSYNPSQGYIATANNAIVAPEYPYDISLDWDDGYRAARIIAMIEAKPRLSIEDIKAIHGDNHNAMGPQLTPLLLSLEFEPEQADLAERLQMLSDWDYQDHLSSSPSALFNAIWHHLILRTFADELPEGWLPEQSRGFLVVSRLLEQPNSAWWDDLGTPEIEDRDDILRLAVAAALEELEKRLGADPSRWRWGDLHGATFVNGVLGRSGIAPIEALFNRGPFPTSGGASIVNATVWSFERGYRVRALPSQRMIVNLADLALSESIHPTGQSGHAYHRNYIDMADLWREIQYHPMLWDRSQVEQAAVARLLLTP